MKARHLKTKHTALISWPPPRLRLFPLKPKLLSMLNRQIHVHYAVWTHYNWCCLLYSIFCGCSAPLFSIARAAMYLLLSMWLRVCDTKIYQMHKPVFIQNITIINRILQSVDRRPCSATFVTLILINPSCLSATVRPLICIIRPTANI